MLDGVQARRERWEDLTDEEREAAEKFLARMRDRNPITLDEDSPF